MADTMTAPANFIAGSGARAPPATPTRSATRRGRTRSSGEFPSSTREDVDAGRPGRRRRSRGLGRRADRQARRRPPAAAALIEERVEAIAQDMTREMGKPLREARMEAARAAQILRYSAGEAFRPVGELYEQAVTGGAVYTVHRPRRRRRPDHAVELPRRDPGLEARAGARLRQHGRAQARPGRAAHRPAHRRARSTTPGSPRVLNVVIGRGSDGRHPARRATPACARSPSRLRAGRRGHPRAGRAPRQARPARARRPQPADRDGRRRPRPRRRGRLRRRVLVGRQKCTATRRIYVQDAGLRRVPRDASSRASSAARSATRPIPRPRSGRSSTRAAMEDVLGAIERGRSEGGPCSPAASAPTTTPTSSPPPCSRTSPTTRCSPARRSSAPSPRSIASATSTTRSPAPTRRVRFSAAIFTRDAPATQHFVDSARGGHPPRQLADRGRRRPRAVRRRQGLGLRPARAGPRRARVLHRGRDRLPGRVEAPPNSAAGKRRVDRRQTHVAPIGGRLHAGQRPNGQRPPLAVTRPDPNPPAPLVRRRGASRSRAARAPRSPAGRACRPPRDPRGVPTRARTARP